MTNEQEEPVVRLFADFLREYNRGRTHDDMSEGLHDLIAAVKDTRKKGTITLTITVAPQKNNQEVLLITDNVVVKAPEFERAAAFYYVDKHGNPTRNDPRQMAFETMQSVPAPHDPSEPRHAQEA